jgi:hypothetical protein
MISDCDITASLVSNDVTSEPKSRLRPPGGNGFEALGKLFGDVVRNCYSFSGLELVTSAMMKIHRAHVSKARDNCFHACNSEWVSGPHPSPNDCPFLHSKSPFQPTLRFTY